MKYEMMVILRPDIGEDETKKELDEVRGLISKNGGNILQEDIWGLRDLAYSIKKFAQGFYAVFNFEMPDGEVKSLDKPLNLSNNVVRYMVMKTPKNYEFKTLAEYQADAKQEAAERAKAKEEKEAEKKARRAPKKTKPKAEKKEKVDEKKLDSIIDDPDITL